MVQREWHEKRTEVSNDDVFGIWLESTINVNIIFSTQKMRDEFFLFRKGICSLEIGNFLIIFNQNMAMIILW